MRQPDKPAFLSSAALSGLVLLLVFTSTQAAQTAHPDETYNGADAALIERGISDRVIVRPGLHVSAAYHSNPYLRPPTDVNRSSFVIDFDPSLQIDLPINEHLYMGLFGKLGLKFYYFEQDGTGSDSDTLEYRSYTEYDDEDNLIIQPFISGKIRLNPTEHISLALYDDFQVANVDKVSNLDADDFDEVRRFYMNNLWLQAEAQFSERLAATLWYRNTLHFQTDNPTLFDFREDTVGGSLPWRAWLGGGNRAVRITPGIQYGERQFDSGNYLETGADGSDVSTHPKDYTFLHSDVSLVWPCSSLCTIYLTGGWQVREYESDEGGRSDRTESPTGGATVSLTPSPGSRIGLVLAASYQVTDTVVYNTPEYNRLAFEYRDAAFNELNITYRELAVSRLGSWLRYDITSLLRAYAIASFQRSEGEAEDDLLGTKIDDTRVKSKTKQDELVLGGALSLRLTEALQLGLAYRHGTAKEHENEAGSLDLFEYDEVSLQLDLHF